MKGCSSQEMFEFYQLCCFKTVTIEPACRKYGFCTQLLRLALHKVAPMSHQSTSVSTSLKVYSLMFMRLFLITMMQKNEKSNRIRTDIRENSRLSTNVVGSFQNCKLSAVEDLLTSKIEAIDEHKCTSETVLIETIFED